ncbi:MAG: hypothetical protein LBH89_05590, partial [Lactococcus lactis]|nr:hypothetical protein [Lactococcus lactis]
MVKKRIAILGGIMVLICGSVSVLGDSEHTSGPPEVKLNPGSSEKTVSSSASKPSNEIQKQEENSSINKESTTSKKDERATEKSDSSFAGHTVVISPKNSGSALGNYAMNEVAVLADDTGWYFSYNGQDDTYSIEKLKSSEYLTYSGTQIKRVQNA